MGHETENHMRELLVETFKPIYFELENESAGHNVPKGSETHFRLLMVSEKFTGLSRIARQRLVNEALKTELSSGPVHALSQRLLTPAEWTEQGRPDHVSPPCHGGSAGHGDRTHEE